MLPNPGIMRVQSPPSPIIDFVNLMKRITGKSDRIHIECIWKAFFWSYR